MIIDDFISDQMRLNRIEKIRPLAFSVIGRDGLHSAPQCMATAAAACGFPVRGITMTQAEIRYKLFGYDN